MAEWIEDKYELERIRTSAKEVIDKMTSILHEAERIRAYVPYMCKKVSDAEWALCYVKNTCAEVLEDNRKEVTA